ncbi:hypothetical protein NXS19_004018 [Fusarium pseudograminearum]|nr:hypothetical protein NXS19_004018 [Fusarium pseudograminearum]
MEDRHVLLPKALRHVDAFDLIQGCRPTLVLFTILGSGLTNSKTKILYILFMLGRSINAHVKPSETIDFLKTATHSACSTPYVFII